KAFVGDVLHEKRRASRWQFITASLTSCYQSNLLGESIMLRWALFFAIVAVVAGLLGFTGVAAGAASIAKFLFVLFLILCVVFLVLGFIVTKKIVD
ncbi:MAG: hypothetical protein QOG58_5590, partial [Caballeronia sp.]|nr:hypothetical protein [Caballeronia sp.]